MGLDFGAILAFSFPLLRLESPIVDPVIIFALVMFILLTAPMMFERLRIPGMVGLIAAGIVIGPHGFNLVVREGIFEFLGKAGLIYLMFLAGLEINLRQFNRQRRDSMIFGSLTFLIPQITGTLLARWLLGFSWPASVLLASMFASHTLVSYPIAMRLGIAKSRAVTTSIGGTILTDTAALLVLAVIAEMAGKELSPLFLLQMAVGLVVLVVATLGGLPRLGNWFFRSAEPDGAAEFAFVLASCFIVAALAGWAGFEAIIGAFLAGLALSGHVPEKSVLMSRLQFTGQALLIPFFLLSVGMLVDVGALLSGTRGWLVAGFMVAIVLATKWVAAFASGRALRLTRDETGLVFGLSVNQAAATLAAVEVGRRIGVFGDYNEAVLNGAILMILVTCLVGPWFTDRHGRRLSLAQPLGPEESGQEAPQRILIPVDDENTAIPLMDFALMLRRQEGHEPLYPLNVANEDHEMRVVAAERVLTPAVLRSVSAGAPVQVVTRIDANTAAGILRASRELRASAIIMGWSGRSAARNLVFQRISDHVIEHSRQEVFICRFVQPLNIVQRVVVLAPPLVERLPGLFSMLRDIRQLAGQVSAPVLLLGTSNTLRHVAPQMAERPKVDYHAVEIDDWRGVMDVLSGAVRPGDGIMLLSVRRARLAWQPRLERLPRELSQAFPEHNIVVAYAGEPDTPEVRVQATAGISTGPASAAERPAGPVISRVLVGQTELTLEDRLRSMLQQRFDGSPAVDRILSDVLRVEPIELTSGAVLLHAHVGEVEGSEIIVGAGPKAIAVPGAGDGVQVLFVLLSGANQPASDHLRALAGVAGLSRIPRVVERLAEAPDESVARQALTPAAEDVA